MPGVSAKDASKKGLCKTKLAQLAGDAVAIAASDESDVMSLGDPAKDLTGFGEQARTVICVLLAPSGVGVIPAMARQAGCLVDVIPVGGIVAGKFLESPGDAHLAKHGEIGGRVRGVGVDEGAVPIEEYALDWLRAGQPHGGPE